MLEIYSDRPGYLSIVHIDTHGRAGLLFPNAHQRPDYYPQGSIPAGTPIRIPDSHEAANRAGFHWDYGPPAGRDTIRVFLSEDLDAAGSIRRSVGHEGSSALRSARKLRGDLTRSLVRGIVTAPAESAPAAFDWTVRTVVIDVSAASSAAEID